MDTHTSGVNVVFIRNDEKVKVKLVRGPVHF